MAPKRQKKGTQPPAAVNSNHALPTCEGPKLGKFKDGRAAIQFVDVLSRETSGEDGQVFEVIVKSKRYALKMAREPTPCFVLRHSS
jgi:Kinetochore Sim4 complex subunit FTA2